jgi:hypothetical protein
MFGRLHDDTDAAALGQRQRTHKARAQK